MDALMRRVEREAEREATRNVRSRAEFGANGANGANGTKARKVRNVPFIAAGGTYDSETAIPPPNRATRSGPVYLSVGVVVEFVEGEHDGKEGTIETTGFPTKVRLAGPFGELVEVHDASDIRPVVPFGEVGERVRVIHGQLKHRDATVLFAKSVVHEGRNVVYAWLDVPFKSGMERTQADWIVPLSWCTPFKATERPEDVID